MASSDTEAPLSDPVAVALFDHVKTIIMEHASLDDDTKKTYVDQALITLTTSFAEGEDLKIRVTLWRGALTAVLPEMMKSNSIPTKEALYNVGHAAMPVPVEVRVPDLLLHFEELPGATFVRPQLGFNCQNVDNQTVDTKTLGWYKPDALGVDRVAYGSMVLGSSGIGKTYLMVYAIPKQLAEACLSACYKPNLPAVLLTVGVTLGGLVNLDRTLKLATADADTVFKSIKATIEGQVTTCCEAYNAKIIEEYNAKNQNPPRSFFVHLVIDEVGVYPGLFSNLNRFKELASAIWKGGRGNDPGRADPDTRHQVVGVHVSVGGTAAEAPNIRLASNIDEVKKLRLEPWSVEMAELLINDHDSRRRSILRYLADRSALVRAVLSVPRMAVRFVEAMAADEFPHTCDPSFWSEGTVIRLCERAIVKYCSENGIQKLQGVADRKRDKRLMAVGACALAAVMLQSSDGAARKRKKDATELREADTWEKAVPIAEHLGFVVCNLGLNDAVENAPYPYTMPPGLTLVALWLMRVPWEFLSDWSTLEIHAALQQTLRVALACLSFRPAERDMKLIWPSAVQHLKVPFLRNLGGPNFILPVWWTSSTGPRCGPAGSSTAAAAVVIADFPTDQTTSNTPLSPRRWTPQPLVSVPLAAAPDVYGHRCFVQCKFSVPTDPRDGATADLMEELRKTGLLRTIPTKGVKTSADSLRKQLRQQQLTCDLMLRHWRDCERSNSLLRSNLVPPSLDQISTAFDRFMYPLSELTERLVGRGFTRLETKSSVAPGLTAGSAATFPEHDGDSRGRQPRNSTTKPGPEQNATDPTGGQQWREWVEFRFVVTPCVRLRIGQKKGAPLITFGRVEPVRRTNSQREEGLSRVLAVFTRADTKARWTTETTLGQQYNDALEEVASQLRTDTDLSTVVVSFTITTDPSATSISATSISADRVGSVRLRNDSDDDSDDDSPRPTRRNSPSGPVAAPSG
jgi:hypothetical protein